MKILIYLLFIIAIFVFAILPAHAAGSLVKALVLGAFLGGICYATYDLTNLATLKDWPVKLVVVDLIWGSILSATVATVTFILSKYINL